MDYINLTIKNDVALINLNNLKKLNALSTEFINELYEKLKTAEKQSKVVIIHGCEKAFCVGVDIDEINSMSFKDSIHNDFLSDKWEFVSKIKIPTIAAVSGYVFGGGFELALMCDMLLASDNSVFSFPEVNLGLMPGLGGTQILTKLVGPKIAAEIIFTGRKISAHEAKDLHIVSKVVEYNYLLDTACELATNIAQKSFMSLYMIKKAIDVAMNTSLNEGKSIERILFKSLFDTEEKQNAIEKFLKK